MALDATVGGSNSNSFATADEANAYFEMHPFGAAWLALGVDEQEAYLILASSRLSALCWTGIAATPEQSLAWPRSGMTSSGGYPVPPDVIPREVKVMTFELANRYLTEGATANSSTVDQSIKLVKAGSVSVEYFNPLDRTIAYSNIGSDITLLGVSSWFCREPKKVAEFEVIPRGEASGSLRTIIVPYGRSSGRS